MRRHVLMCSHFAAGTGLVFVIDSNDRERFDEAYSALKGLVTSIEHGEGPVVILANKQDLPSAASCDEVAEALKLSSLPIGYVINFILFMIFLLLKTIRQEICVF